MIYQNWFTPQEHQTRVERVQEHLRTEKLEALLAFQPETITYLTGYFTRGYDTFQFALIPTTGEPLIVCRDMERYYLETTSVYANHKFWRDGEDKMAIALKAISQFINQTSRCGLELDSWQLNARRYLDLKAGLPEVTFVDCSQLVSRQRIIKSPAEIAYQRQAGLAAEAGMTAAITSATPGNSEREMAAEICAAMIRAGSDLPGPGVLSSGERAFHLHGGYSDRIIEEGDHVQVETTPNVRHYHARFMRPIKAGQASDEDHEVVGKLIDIQDKALAEVGPGIVAGVPDRLYREGVLGARLLEKYTNKTFYSVGLMLNPNSGEPLEATAGSTWTFEPGMTLHTYVLARGFGLSETIAITPTGFERLTNYPRQLFVAK